MGEEERGEEKEGRGEGGEGGEEEKKGGGGREEGGIEVNFCNFKALHEHTILL